MPVYILFVSSSIALDQLFFFKANPSLSKFIKHPYMHPFI